MKYVIKFFNSCLYGKVSYIAVMFNCNKNDLFNPPTPPQPLKTSVPPLLSYWLGATMKNNFRYKKNLFSKQNLISKWHSIYLSIVPVRKVPLCNCPNTYNEELSKQNIYNGELTKQSIYNGELTKQSIHNGELTKQSIYSE